MKTSSNLKAIALQALRGKWGIAVLAGIIAAFLGGITSESGGSLNLEKSDGETIGMLINNGEYAEIFMIVLFIVAIVALALAVVFLILGSVVELGYAHFNLNLVDGREAGLGDLFSYFKYTGRAIGARLLRSLYIALWTLLLVIPGIVKSYSYAMTPYILAENPDMTAAEAITRSKEMMYGHRWNLFCLEISFIGWRLLCLLTLGIGNLWLRPYMQASGAAFYREVSQTWKNIEVTAEYEIE
jgi:uncharacterized membrane protein